MIINKLQIHTHITVKRKQEVLLQKYSTAWHTFL